MVWSERHHLKFALGLVLFLAASAQTLASECSLQFALASLRDSPMISQNDLSLVRKGLLTAGEVSMLCGPVCGFHLMQAMRRKFNVSPAFKTPADEIEAMAKVGYTFGQNVAKDGMTLNQIRMGIAGDLALHGIQAETEVVTALRGRNPQDGSVVKRVQRIEVGDLLAPKGFEQVNIISVSEGDNLGGHVFLVELVDGKSGLVSLIDPVIPDTKMIMKLTHPNAADPASPLILTFAVDAATALKLPGNLPQLRVNGFIRVRTQEGAPQ